jgi:hypothetical protein
MTSRPTTTAALRICSNCSEYGLADGSRYGYVILHSWQSGLIPRLKASNPNVKVLVYKNVAATYSYACSGGADASSLPSGVGYCWAVANAPGWLLTDAAGKRIEFCDYSGLWLMDVGDPAYQRQWLDAVSADAVSKGFDGVMLDDVDQDVRAHLCARTIGKYRTDADWTAATSAFMATVGPELQRRGLLVLPNIMIRNWWESSGIALFDRWLGYSSGAIQEYYAKWNVDSSGWFTDDGAGHDNWSYRQAFLRRTQSAGKIFIGLTYAPSGDARSQRYARGSFLLDWDGGASAVAFEPTDPEQQDPYTSIWTADLGTPLGPRYRVGQAWRRDYSEGAVVVNTSTAGQTVDLGGSFLQPDGTTVTSVALQSADAAILRNSAGGSPALPPPPPSRTGGTSGPTVVVAPSFTIKDHRKLSGNSGVWSGTSLAFAYGWERCRADQSVCSNIPRATSLNYQLSRSDVGWRLRLRVTASNGGGTSTAYSGSTGVVSNSGKL